jgi:hypothetical protein
MIKYDLTKFLKVGTVKLTPVVVNHSATCTPVVPVPVGVSPCTG